MKNLLRSLLAITALLMSYPALAQNAGFESGNFNGWNISSGGGTTAPGAWTGDGAGVTITTGMTNFCPGDNKCWTVKPYGTHMAALQAGWDSPTFDTAMNTLGLSGNTVTEIKNTINANGGMFPTNAASISKTVTLQAGVTYTYAWQYISSDYMPFNDGSIITLVKQGDPSATGTVNGQNKQYALLGFTNTGTGSYSVGSYGATGWQVAQFTVTTDGVYILGFASFNLGDTVLSPILFIDEMQGTTELNGQAFGSIQPNSGSGAPPPPPPPPPPGPTYCCGGSDASFNANAQFNNRAVTFYTSLNHGAIVDIEQIGNSNNITITQLGTRLNYVKYYANGNNNTLTSSQTSTSGLAMNYTEFTVNGSNNTTSLTQTSTGGNKGIYANVSNNNNNVTILQKDNGNHYAELTLSGSDKTVNLTQQGSAGHMVNITLSGGASSITTTQSGATQQFYSINYNCATSSCAPITVTQGNQ